MYKEIKHSLLPSRASHLSFIIFFLKYNRNIIRASSIVYYYDITHKYTTDRSFESSIKFIMYVMSRTSFCSNVLRFVRLCAEDNKKGFFVKHKRI